MPIKRARSAYYHYQQKKVQHTFPAPNEVTEESLKVWRNLPAKIRQDPSMVSFRVENERLHGEIFDDDQDGNFGDQDDESSQDNSEFITINVTNETGESQEIDHIKEKDVAHPTHSHQAIGPAASTSTASHARGSIPVANYNPSGAPHQSTLPPKDDHDNPCKNNSKIVCLFFAWFFVMILLMITNEKDPHSKHISIPPYDSSKSYLLPELPTSYSVKVSVHGAFLSDDFANMSTHILEIRLQGIMSNLHLNNTKDDIGNYTTDLAYAWKIPCRAPSDFDTTDLVKKTHTFTIKAEDRERLVEQEGLVRVLFKSNMMINMPLKFGVDISPINQELGILYSAFVLVFLYALIIWEVVHRTFAAILASCLSIALLAALNDRPTVEEIISWIDVEIILLLFSMMLLVGIMTETGVFDYLAVYAYKIANGSVWALIHCLCIFTTLISALLDNVTTVLLMAPMTVRLCEVMDLNPIPVLMAIVVHANIGGLMTPVGDPPNVIITSNHYILQHGVTFMLFTLHMTVGVIILTFSTSLHLRWKFRNINSLLFHESKEIKELRRNILVWERAAQSISPFTKDANIVRETIMRKVKILKHHLKKRIAKGVLPSDRYKRTLEEMQKEFPIKNKPLLIKCTVVLIFITALFFIESIDSIRSLSVGWSALLGVILLLIVADKNDMDAVLHKIEWPTLLFFAAMFVVMESVERMGLIDCIGKLTELIILSVSEAHRLAVALIIILWLSAITSAFVDSIPVTTMMTKIVVNLAKNKALGLPLHPLVWALAFGPCLGGNGTLIGGSANILVAGIAEQHGYRFSFMDYFRLGFPIMLVSVATATAYLLGAHVIFGWQ
ncbi:P protein-like isoform X2 [Culicoides brevitarsis]|uniref:P protein-like isoform X2 n=1 Tax=Culicoides brevitarsis TaxID=469753 RepID=UPI00307B6E32